MQYQWAILQDGQLPLKVDGRVTLEQHLCTVTLIWPRRVAPSPSNSLIVDPCFSANTVVAADARLQQLNTSLDRIGYFFETHGHFDHKIRLPRATTRDKKLGWRRRRSPIWKSWSGESGVFPDVDILACPGHAADLQAIFFRGRRGVVCVASDAILSRQWLLAWQYYWPNVYDASEIVDTWRSLAKIIETADTVIPGHGPPIEISPDLLQELIDNFPRAEYGSSCPQVTRILSQRLEQLRQRDT